MRRPLLTPRARRGAMEPATRLRQSPIPAILAVVGRGIRRMSAEFNSDRAGRDTGQIAEEVLQNLTTLPSGKVRVTVEIEAEIPNGVSEDIQLCASSRTVSSSREENVSGSGGERQRA